MRGMGDEGDEGDEGAHPGESRPRLREIGGDWGRVAPDCHSSAALSGPQRPSAALSGPQRPSAALSGLHLGGVAPNGHGPIIRARDLVIPHADARARAVANLADLGATCPN